MIYSKDDIFVEIVNRAFDESNEISEHDIPDPVTGQIAILSYLAGAVTVLVIMDLILGG